MKSAIESFENSLRELDSTHRAIVSLEGFISTYTIESMEGVELDMAIHYIDNLLESNGIVIEDQSFENEGATTASSAATTGTTTSPTGQSKGEKVKKFAEDTLKKMKEKLKTLPEEIKKYAALVMDTLSNSSKSLSNTANQILSKLDSVEETQNKITGNFQIFTEVRPQAAVESVSKGISSLGDQGKSALDVIGKLSDTASSNLTLYNYKGMEFKFDGTAKFFDMKIESKKVEINGLSKTDVKLVCDKVIALSSSIDRTKERLPNVAGLIETATRRAESSSNKEGIKAAMALGSFYRTVVGGYIKYTIKISKMALSAANGSIKSTAKTEERKDD